MKIHIWVPTKYIPYLQKYFMGNYGHMCIVLGTVRERRLLIIFILRGTKMWLVRVSSVPENHKQCRKPSTSLLCSSSFSALVVAAGTFRGCLPRSTLHCFSMAGFSLYEGSLKAHKIPLKPRNISPVEVYCPQDVSYVRLVLIGLPLLNMLSHALPSLWRWLPPDWAE